MSTDMLFKSNYDLLLTEDTEMQNNMNIENRNKQEIIV